LIIIKEDEVAVVIRLGEPKKVLQSGMSYILWPLERVKRFSTNLLELNFTTAGIVTAKTKDIGELNIGLEMAMYFRWPEGEEELFKTLRIISDPEDIPAIANLFEETVLDATRSAGSSKTWKDIITDRASFAREIKENLLNEASDPMKQAGIPKETMRLAIKHLKLPEGFKDTISEPEIQRLKMDAAKHEANAMKIKMTGEGEGLKAKTILEGEGIAQARRDLYAAIGDDPENMKKETLLTLREMAHGTSNTILFPIPSKLTDALENIFGKPAAGSSFQDMFSKFSKTKQEAVIKFIENL
jgi:regulator of protease activity HflC (stomatin/prohibitin superfamily)